MRTFRAPRILRTKMRRQPEASCPTFLWGDITHLSSASLDTQHNHHMRGRAFLRTSGKYYLSPPVSSLCGSCSTLTQENFKLHKRRSIHRLAHTDLIRTVTEQGHPTPIRRRRVASSFVQRNGSKRQENKSDKAINPPQTAARAEGTGAVS